MATINSKDNPKAECQVLYNLHDMHLVALSQRPPEVPYMLRGCGKTAAVFPLLHTPSGQSFRTGNTLSLFACKTFCLCVLQKKPRS